MRFISDDKVRFLGKRKSENDKGTYYSISVCDADGQSMRFYCSEECYEQLIAQNLDFGEELQLDLEVSQYNGKFSARVNDATKM